MEEPQSEQLGSALRKLIGELIDARRRLAVLRRENRELRAELEALQSPPNEPEADER